MFSPGQYSQAAESEMTLMTLDVSQYRVFRIRLRFFWTPLETPHRFGLRCPPDTHPGMLNHHLSLSPMGNPENPVVVHIPQSFNEARYIYFIRILWERVASLDLSFSIAFQSNKRAVVSPCLDTALCTSLHIDHCSGNPTILRTGKYTSCQPDL